MNEARVIAVLVVPLLISGLAHSPSLAGAEQAAKSLPITALAITPDGQGLIEASQSGVFARKFGKENRHRIPSKLDHIHALAFSPNQKILAVAGGSPAEEGAVELWSWPQLELLNRFAGHKDVVYDVVWLGNGARLATAGADRAVRLWNVAQAKKSISLSGHSGPVLALAATPDGKWLCSGSADQTIRVWETKTGKLVRSLTNHLGAVQDLAFRPAANKDSPPYLASAGADETIRIWQPTIGRMVRIIRHPSPVSVVVWSGDGSKLFSGAKDGKLRVIDGDSDEILKVQSVSQHRILSMTLGAGRNTLVIGDGKGKVSKHSI